MTFTMADGGTDQRDIGWRIRLLREAMGQHNAAAFAGFVGWTAQQLNNYERGAKRPEVSMAVKLCQKTSVTLDWIYRGERSGLPMHVVNLIQAQIDAEADRQSKLA